MQKIEVRNSDIHGKGLFAIQDIKQGETVLNWDISKKYSQFEYDILDYDITKYVTSINGVHIFMQEPERFLNHSCNPNTTTKGYRDIAIRDIAKGEQITGNYNEVCSDGPEIVCKCGSKNCKGKIFN